MSEHTLGHRSLPTRPTWVRRNKDGDLEILIGTLQGPAKETAWKHDKNRDGWAQPTEYAKFLGDNTQFPALAKALRAPNKHQAVPNFPNTFRVSIGEQKDRNAWNIPMVFKHDLDTLAFDKLSDKPIPLPPKLAKELADPIYRPKILDRAKLERIIDTELKRQGLGYATPREAIEAAKLIPTALMEYIDVDQDEDFIAKHGKSLAIEDYLELGWGDCQRFRDGFTVCLELFRARNPKLCNLHVGEQGLGGHLWWHAWNCLILVFPEHWEVTHVDPTFFKSVRQFESTTESHVPEDKRLFVARFLAKIGASKAAWPRFEVLLRTATDQQERAQLLREIAYHAESVGNYAVVHHARRRFEAEITDEALRKRYHDSVLYWSLCTEAKQGDVLAAHMTALRIMQLYPESYWIENRCVARALSKARRRTGRALDRLLLQAAGLR